MSYEDLVLENLALETGSLGGRSTAPVSLHVDARRGAAGEKASLDVHFELRADTAAEHYSLGALTLASAVSLAGNPQPVRFSVSAPAVDLDLKAETVSAPALKVNAGGAMVSASLQGTKIMDAMNLKGTVKLEPVALREVLPPLGIALPKTRDPKALSRIAASSDFAYGKGRAEFENLQATLDDTHLKGSLGARYRDRRRQVRAHRRYARSGSVPAAAEPRRGAAARRRSRRRRRPRPNRSRSMPTARCPSARCTSRP